LLKENLKPPLGNERGFFICFLTFVYFMFSNYIFALLKAHAKYGKGFLYLSYY